MWIRIPLAGITGLMTMGCLYGMLFGLVQSDLPGGSTLPVQRIEFSPVKIDTPEATISRLKPEHKPLPQAPGGPTFELAPGPVSPGPGFLPGPTSDGGFKLGPPTLYTGGIEREPIPLVRIQPQYPPRAAAMGTEGWVRVQFNIGAGGTVSDAVVTDSEPRGTFDRAALEAVARWKYNPRVENGVAVERRGVQVLLTFQLDR